MPDLRDRLAAALSPRYVVERELATGGMGMVFLGHDPTLGREVAIKVLPPEHATAVAVERFLRETRLLAQLAHPNIVPIFEAQHSGQLLWFVMPRIRGDTLAQRLASGPLPAGDVVRVGADLLKALEHAHANGVIHRDIKPSNIFVDGEQTLLADFGVASLNASQSEALTGTDQVVGTLGYMAPEQRFGGHVTERTDIYALGMTLFEAATGKRWDRVDATSSRVWRSLPKPLGRALRGALHHDPERRWEDARAFRRALGATGSFPSSRTLALVAVAGIIVVAGVLARGPRSAGPIPRQRAAIVILPFRNGPAALGTALANHTSLSMEFARVHLLQFSNVNQMTFDSARRVADRVVTGELYIGSSGADSISVSVYGSDGQILSVVTIAGDARSASTWGHAIADSLVRRLFPSQLPELRQLAGTHPNGAALDAYAEGQQLFQQGQWHEAEERFARAEQIDSSLVPAIWQKLITRQWQALPWKDELARLAARVKSGPGPLAGLVAAQLEPDLELRLARYDSLVGQYPHGAVVREMQANELFSRGPLIGRPLSEGIEAFRRSALEIPELDQPNTYTQTVWGAVRLGQEDLARDQLRLRKAPSGDQWTNLLWLAVNGRFRRWLAVPVREFTLRTSDSARRKTLARAVRMGLDLDIPLDQLAIGAYLESHAETNRQRANALAAQSTALLLLGRPLEGGVDVAGIGAQRLAGRVNLLFDGVDGVFNFADILGVAVGRRLIKWQFPLKDGWWILKLGHERGGLLFELALPIKVERFQVEQLFQGSARLVFPLRVGALGEAQEVLAIPLQTALQRRNLRLELFEQIGRASDLPEVGPQFVGILSGHPVKNRRLKARQHAINASSKFGQARRDEVSRAGRGSDRRPKVAGPDQGGPIRVTGRRAGEAVRFVGRQPRLRSDSWRIGCGFGSGRFDGGLRSWFRR